MEGASQENCDVGDELPLVINTRNIISRQDVINGIQQKNGRAKNIRSFLDSIPVRQFLQLNLSNGNQHGKLSFVIDDNN